MENEHPWLNTAGAQSVRAPGPSFLCPLQPQQPAVVLGTRLLSLESRQVKESHHSVSPVQNPVTVNPGPQARLGAPHSFPTHVPLAGYTAETDPSSLLDRDDLIPTFTSLHQAFLRSLQTFVAASLDLHLSAEMYLH